MGKINLVICDEDHLYGKALGEYFMNYIEMFNVVVINNITNINERLEEIENVDIFLLNENIADCFMNMGKVTIILAEKYLQEEKGDTHFFVIYKYIPADKMLEEIKYIYGQVSGYKIPVSYYGKEAKLIGFFSPSGGTGTTSISIGVCRFLAERDKKVLYLNFEDLPSTEIFFPCEQGKKNIADFIYFLFIKENEDVSNYIYNFTFSDKWGVDCFYPQKNCNDLFHLNCDEIRYFLETLCIKAGYDFICIDFSNVIDEKKIFILSMCYKIFQIVGDFEPSRKKSKIFRQYCDASEKLVFLNKSKQILNFCSGNKEEEFYIENDPPSFYEDVGYYHMSLEGKFGNAVKKIADFLIFE